MTDLGLSQLTDDQLVELLSEICAEAAQRDPYVRKAAQNAINEKAAEAKMLRDAARSTTRSYEKKMEDLEMCIRWAIDAATNQYWKQLRDDVYAAIQEEVNTGQIRLVTPEQEAQHILDATHWANEALRNQVGPQVFDANRRAIIDNLQRMGHPKAEIEKIYGKF